MKPQIQWLFGVGAAWLIVKSLLIWRHCRNERNAA